MNNLWQEIEREATEQVRAEVEAAEVTPLEWGAMVAWAECRFGRTDGLGVVHRVESWSLDDARALCGERIPSPVLRLPLTPNLVRTLGRCRYCETAHQQRKGVAA